jgi:hypothetical protein
MLCRLTLACLAAAPLAALAVEPGNWELDVSTTLPGQPQPLVRRVQQCLTEADARDPSRVLGGAGTGLCQFSNRNQSGGTFTFDVACNLPLPLKGTGVVRYTGQSMDGELDLSGDDGAFRLRSSVAGRRLGPC